MVVPVSNVVCMGLGFVKVVENQLVELLMMCIAVSENHVYLHSESFVCMSGFVNRHTVM